MRRENYRTVPRSSRNVTAVLCGNKQSVCIDNTSDAALAVVVAAATSR